MGKCTELERSAPKRRWVAAMPLVAASVVLVLLAGCGKNDTSAGGSTGTTTAAKSGGTDKQPQGTTTLKALRWDKAIIGTPAAFGGGGKVLDTPEPGKAPGGVYIWTELDGWHVRVVKNTGSPEVTVAVTANDGKEGKDDDIKVTKVFGAPGQAPPAPGATVTVKAPTGQAVSGFDFGTGFYVNKLTFTVTGPSGPLPPAQIFLGADPTPAKANPVVVTRTRQLH